MPRFGLGKGRPPSHMMACCWNTSVRRSCPPFLLVAKQAFVFAMEFCPGGMGMGEHCCDEENGLRLNVKFRYSGEVNDDIWYVNVHPNQPWVLFVCEKYGLRTVEVWDYEDNVHVTSLPAPFYGAGWYAAAFSQRENLIMVWDDPWMLVLDMDTSDMAACFELQEAEVTRVHPTLPYILTSTHVEYMNLWVWDREGDAQCVHTFHCRAEVDSIRFHPEDPNIFATASGDKVIEVWNLRMRSVIQTLEGHEHRIRNIMFCNDPGMPLLVSGGDGNDVKVWDYSRGTCVGTLKSGPGTVQAFTFHPTEPYIFTGDMYGIVRVWKGPNYQLVTLYKSGLEAIYNMLPCRNPNMIALGGPASTVVLEVFVQRNEIQNMAGLSHSDGYGVGSQNVTEAARTIDVDKEGSQSQKQTVNDLISKTEGVGSTVSLAKQWSRLRSSERKINPSACTDGKDSGTELSFVLEAACLPETTHTRRQLVRPSQEMRSVALQFAASSLNASLAQRFFRWPVMKPSMLLCF
ncbi:hypothetical protein CBR_g39559 [Chara braunii]|uniref:Uncharacterized protein n=1 Tax=Chara braunii TaxID=69332 RepID=A0A388LRY2_CHABU|nr:hypothetical protein CBR_g39559 [Chara braunii]|eukprot:GBG85098.1 hypothetical protein CBR_g39559 [Chara braunii]